MKKYIKANKTWDDDFMGSLVVDLVRFMQDYDWYGYADTLEVGETEEEATNEMYNELLINPEGVITTLYEIGQSDDSVSDICNDLIDRINEILPA